MAVGRLFGRFKPSAPHDVRTSEVRAQPVLEALARLWRDLNAHRVSADEVRTEAVRLHIDGRGFTSFGVWFWTALKEDEAVGGLADFYPNACGFFTLLAQASVAKDLDLKWQEPDRFKIADHLLSKWRSTVRAPCTCALGRHAEG